ncbi:DUF4190 domain-containing protein [Jeotgalibacillus proteolyticus]|uniref:DUF4190 domain-containing protein n=1 Tax=Jeotgalibacillus proteolyticus TaxID=2082395 RepID=A0A2S5GEK2_9BACL|nr:DUF4190 domain-containing protein [Jeotgalibacillus proteolyticus]PPA71426.1 hypothetical protein C4B60_05020 [Jeotgalibacillus proteolyticus]
MYDEEKNQTGLEKNYERASYDEEFANELAQLSEDQSYAYNDEPARDGKIENTNKGIWLGYASLIVGIIALFTAPVLFGVLAIILGFIARNAGSRTAGSWGIGLGAFSIVLGIVLLPFF